MPAYAAGLAAKNGAYTGGWLKSKRLQAPVISVGNLSVGGAGKTPLVIRLAELLAARGFAVDVLSRGYGRRSSAAEQVPPALADQSGQASERYGDEPLLIAQAAGVPVYVGASRYAAGLLAEQTAAAERLAARRVHLLDDGFQHRRLARAADIVVLHRSDFTGELMPAGRLREPLSALERASVAVLRVEDALFAPELRRRFPHLPIWWMTREISVPEAAIEVTPSEQVPAVAFCGLARPEEFFSALTRAGVSLSATHAFRDHHAYSARDVGSLVQSAQASGARCFLTTEKDLIRLSTADRANLHHAAALHAVPLRARLLEEEAAIRQLLTLIGLAP